MYGSIFIRGIRVHFLDRRQVETDTVIPCKATRNGLKMHCHNRKSNILVNKSNIMANNVILPSFLIWFLPPSFFFGTKSTDFYNMSIRNETDSISRPTPRGVRWRPWRPFPCIHGDHAPWTKLVNWYQLWTMVQPNGARLASSSKPYQQWQQEEVNANLDLT